MLGLGLIQSLASRHLPLGFLYKSAGGGVFLKPVQMPIKTKRDMGSGRDCLMSIVPSSWVCDEDHIGMNSQSYGRAIIN